MCYKSVYFCCTLFISWGVSCHGWIPFPRLSIVDYGASSLLVSRSFRFRIGFYFVTGWIFEMGSSALPPRYHLRPLSNPKRISDALNRHFNTSSREKASIGKRSSQLVSKPLRLTIPSPRPSLPLDDLRFPLNYFPPTFFVERDRRVRPPSLIHSTNLWMIYFYKDHCPNLNNTAAIWVESNTDARYFR